MNLSFSIVLQIVTHWVLDLPVICKIQANILW